MLRLKASAVAAQQQLPWPMVVLLDVLLAPLLLCAVLWVYYRQAKLLREGQPLNPVQCALALSLGIVAVERVRVMLADVVPMPLPRWARDAAQRAGWISRHIAGMTLGHGIVLRKAYRDDMCLLAHELAHVRQYERLGGIVGFLRQYLRECVWPGYPDGPLEIEARAAETRGSMQPVDVIPYMSTVTDPAVPPRAGSGAGYFSRQSAGKRNHS